MKKIFDFLKRNVWLIVGPTIGATWGSSLAHTITGGLSLPTIILLQTAWLVAIISIIGLVVQIKTERERIQYIETKISGAYQSLFDSAKAILDQATGYDEEMSEKITVYSKMKNDGVISVAANAIMSFAAEVSPADTVFLIRVSHSEGLWYFKMAGRQIHFEQASAVLEQAVKYMDTSSELNGIVLKKKDGIVN